MTGVIASTMPHLVVLPILLPLACAAVMLLIGESNRRVKAILSVIATVVYRALCLRYQCDDICRVRPAEVKLTLTH